MKKEHLYESTICFGIGFGIILFLFISAGCRGPVPKVDVSFWAGDSAKEGISRAQDEKTLACKDPAFDTYTCLTYADMHKIYSTLLQCQKWPDPMSSSQTKKFIKKNHEILAKMFSTALPRTTYEALREVSDLEPIQY